MSWPLNVSFRDGNKETVAHRRAKYLDNAIEALTLQLQNPAIDPVEADGIGMTLAELHLRYERLQDKYFSGDGRSKRKHRKQKKIDATDLLR